MRAFFIRRYGGPDVLEQGELPPPALGARDVRIAVHAASVNPIDWKVRQGKTRAVLPYRFPLVLGNDCSGVDYHARRFEDVVKDADTQLRGFRCVKRGGIVVSITDRPDVAFAKELGVTPLLWPVFLAMGFRAHRAARRHGARYRYLFMRPSGEQLRRIGELVDVPLRANEGSRGPRGERQGPRQGRPPGRGDPRRG